LVLIGLAEISKNIELGNIIKQYNFIIVLIVPVFYLYFKNLINNQNYFAYKDLLHFTIPLLLIAEDKFSFIESLFHYKVEFSFLKFFFVFSILYNVVIFFELKKHVWNKKATLEIAIKQNYLIRNWSIYFYSAMNLMVLRLYFSIFIELKTNSIVTAQYGLWASSIVWLIVFFKILSTPEILYGYSYLAKKSREYNSNIKSISQWTFQSKVKINNLQEQQLKEKISHNIEKYMLEIDTLIQQNNYFRNPKFTMDEFAILLKIPKSHLKFIFKYHSKISFSDFKKIARVQDALVLIDQNFLTTNTFEALSKKVGFTSYNPFFTSFKDVVGKSPQEYILQLNKE
jgi:AraC-like DNA-binding protein